MPNTFSDLTNAGLYGVSVVPQTIATATTTNGTSVDMANSDDSVELIVATGNCGDSSLVLDVKLQEAIEDPASAGTALSSNWSDMAGQVTTTAAITQLTGATLADNKCLVVSSRRRTKRFVRAVVTTAGGGTLSVPIACVVLGRKKISGTGVGYVTTSHVNT